MSGVRVVGLTKRYEAQEAPALSEFDLDVAPGEFMAIMGESGSGKTTLLRLIAGLEIPDDGDIYVGGRWMNEISVGRRPVQMIFQTLALWPHLKVMDERSYSNLSFPLKVRRWSRLGHLGPRPRRLPARGAARGPVPPQAQRALGR